MPITVLKNNVPWGPFTRAQVQDGLARGDFTLQYLAHSPGLKEWLPLGEVLDYFDRGKGLPPVPGPSTGPPSAPGLFSAPSSGPPTTLPSSPLTIAAVNASPVKTAVPPPMPMRIEEPVKNEPSIPPRGEAPKAPVIAASFFPRFIAFAIDCGVLFLPILFLFGLSWATIEIHGLVEHSDGESMLQDRALVRQDFVSVLKLVALGGAWLYAALLECSRWQATVGKQWMRMKVVDVQGDRLSFFRATGRHAAKFLSALPVFLGFTMALFSAQRLALHDRIAGTRVVRK